MTGRERLLKTLRGEAVDRVPISPFLYYNNMYEMFGHRPRMGAFFDPPDFDVAGKFVEFCDCFGFDVIHFMGGVGDSYLVRSAENWDVQIQDEGDDDERQRVTVIRTPKGELRQVMNLRRVSPYLIVFAIDEYVIKTPEDFNVLAEFIPPASQLDCGLVSRCREAVGDKGIVVPATYDGAFNAMNMFRKLEDIMMDPYTDEGFYREMISFFADWNMVLFRKILAAGADGIELGANLATSAVGPRFFKDYVLEYENRLARGIHQGGGVVIFHNCGDADKIVHLYNDLEIDCWGYLTGPPFGDVDLDRTLAILRPDLALRGNIDQVEFLVKATPAQVSERVEQLLYKVMPRGNWILSTSDFFFDGTPYENIRTFSEAGHRFGVY